MFIDNPPHASNPLFGLLIRFWMFVQQVYLRRVPWRLSDAAAELEVSERTIRRYVEFAKMVLTDGDGQPLIVLEVRDGRTWVVLRKFLLPFEALIRH